MFAGGTGSGELIFSYCWYQPCEEIKRKKIEMRKGWVFSTQPYERWFFKASIVAPKKLKPRKTNNFFIAEKCARFTVHGLSFVLTTLTFMLEASNLLLIQISVYATAPSESSSKPLILDHSFCQRHIENCNKITYYVARHHTSRNRNMRTYSTLTRNVCTTVSPVWLWSDVLNTSNNINLFW